MARRLSSFQTLALWTTGTTYFLILVGGLVRASGAGLGCPDWPRCFGGWIPPASAADLPAGFEASQFNATLMWTEYLNRLLGVAVGLLILATLVSAWRHHRQTARIFWPTLAAFLLVGFQGWLGGVVVQQELAAWIVTVHLVVALVIVSLLLYVTMYAFFASRVGTHGAGTGRASCARRGDRPCMPAPAPRPLLAWSVVVLMVITLLQVILGTQVREGIDEALGAGVARPDALATVGRFDGWHREAAWLVIAATGWVVWLVWTRHRTERTLVRVTMALAALVGLQVLLGASMAYLALTPPAQVAHLTASSLLLGAETVLFLLARWLPAGPAELALSSSR
ncbi:MAG TPA: COX15/CtaA family protein [Vicinamibacterales bacterium]|nr:COX15/CtaA family protein [Vicinamibacterales bacterium]